MFARQFIASAVLISAASVTSAAQANHAAAIRQDAAQLSAQADQLLRETRAFAHSANYRSVVVLASRLRADAIRFERSLGGLNRTRDLERQLDALDHLAHDLSDEVFDASRGPRYDRFAAHFDTRRAQQLVRSIEHTIHCLDDHLADLPARGVIGAANPPAYYPQPQPRVITFLPRPSNSAGAAACPSSSAAN